jgi:hypothetical protein
LAIFTASLIGYLFCQRAQLMSRCRAAGDGGAGAVRQQHGVVLAAARPVRRWLRLKWPLLTAAVGLVVLGMVANLPRLLAGLAGEPDPDRAC